MEKEEAEIIGVLCSISLEGGQLLPFFSLPFQRFTFLPQAVQFLIVWPGTERGRWGKQEGRVWEYGWASTAKLRKQQKPRSGSRRHCRSGRGHNVVQPTGVGWGPIAGSLDFVLFFGSLVRGGMPPTFRGNRKNRLKEPVDVTQNCQCRSHKLSVAS